MTPTASVAFVATVADRYEALLDGHDGTLRHPGLAWTAAAYVCHVADNLRIWAERLAAAALAGNSTVAGYDDNLLARSRKYNEIPVAGALWSLRHSVAEWLEAVEVATRSDVVLIHPERGAQTMDDVTRNNAHDAWQHEWDIRRTIQVGRPARSGP